MRFYIFFSVKGIQNTATRNKRLSTVCSQSRKKCDLHKCKNKALTPILFWVAVSEICNTPLSVFAVYRTILLVT